MVGAPIKPTGPTPQPPQKPRPEVLKRESGAQRRNGRPPGFVCALISVWIVWHISAIFLAAMATPGPSSQLVLNVAEHPKSPMRWYLDAFYLNQGHSFFAPDVGPGSFLRYELFDKNNQKLADGLLPDKEKFWSRLFYHRHMMLADQVGAASPDPAARVAETKRSLETYGRQILRMNRSAQAVRVQLIAHYPLPLDFISRYGRQGGYQQLAREYEQGGSPHRPNSDGYAVIGEAVQRRSDLPPEPDPPLEPEQQTFAPSAPSNPNLNWQSDRPNMANRRQGVPRR